MLGILACASFSSQSPQPEAIFLAVLMGGAVGCPSALSIP